MSFSTGDDACSACVEFAGVESASNDEAASTLKSARPSKAIRKAEKLAKKENVKTFQPLSKQAAHLLRVLNYGDRLSAARAYVKREEQTETDKTKKTDEIDETDNTKQTQVEEQDAECTSDADAEGDQVHKHEPDFAIQKTAIPGIPGTERASTETESTESTRLAVTITPLELNPDDVSNHVQCKFRVEHGAEWWIVESKVVFAEGTQLEPHNLQSIAAIAARFAPPTSTVRLQADTHGAGNVFVGMIMSVDAGENPRIPINLISGDIGCGLSVLPLVRAIPRVDASGAQEQKIAFVHESLAALGDATRSRNFCAFVTATLRRCLLRGKAAENGAFLATNLVEAAAFYGFDELPEWLDDMRAILESVGTRFESYKRSELDKICQEHRNKNKTENKTEDKGKEQDLSRDAAAALVPRIEGLTFDQAIVLRFISRYAQSLGSSGNHFCELSVDDSDGKLWFVVHSGSRGIGSLVYSVIAEACRFLEGGFEVATGAMAVFYQGAFDALCKFAKLNRVLCALAALRELGYETRASTLQRVMCDSPVFSVAVGKFGGRSDTSGRAPVLALLGGLVHNGVSCFVDDASATVLFVLKKGAIAMTRRAAASIVALRAGDGCVLWTLADPACTTHEVDVAEGARLLRECGYTQVFDSPHVVYAGHGAGRARATGKTAQMSSFSDIVAFHDSQGMVGNIAPGLLGDNPACAYNDVATVVRALPLAGACTQSRLRTLVAFKEGVSPIPRYNDACAAYVRAAWPTATDAEKLTFDLNLCQRSLGATVYNAMAVERDAIFASFLSQFCQYGSF